jgi:hypothetical protein
MGGQDEHLALPQRLPLGSSHPPKAAVTLVPRHLYQASVGSRQGRRAPARRRR